VAGIELVIGGLDSLSADEDNSNLSFAACEAHAIGSAPMLRVGLQFQFTVPWFAAP
jgi:hypothetical protein